ncbi:alpha/beta fold hydrolase [Hymenobacter chitinivorans]|uniref:Pimeloyl-ACP methyl ester carboxylesterase n=1 Tax=Hymenobacter chitinivorans DSM 11115 TaxID=1121954 RepID=A0A2M9BQU8_9BACT|nr:alpha/beta hydrolase [Hymenobacter chitinivorans]PJJ60282.1 pimeloyl-ACP methyl ester carboxylesterase [Hymenobacter chitinivorans DSM 11115]
MKQLLFSLRLGLLLLGSGTARAQGPAPANPYAAARRIIADHDSIVTPNGVQETYALPIGGVKQWVYVRGQDRRNPIILFVHGGPASPMAPVSWMFQRPLEEYFTVVQYDQRAAGKTYATNDTTNLGATIRIEQYVDDAIALAEAVRQKYGQPKVILMGHSWGTIVGMRAALKRPDLFYAYVGIGQVISVQDNERLSFEYALKRATAEKNETALRELRSIAPYPGNQPITRERIIIARTWPQYYGGLSAYRSTSDYYFNAPLLSPAYTAAETAAIDQGNQFTLGRLLPAFLQVDFKPVKSFPIPVFMLMGRHDYTTPSEPTAAWLTQVRAPLKKGVWFENSAHLIPLEEPGKLLLTLVNEVRPLAAKPAGRK